jgi:hypothetical protein
MFKGSNKWLLLLIVISLTSCESNRTEISTEPNSSFAASSAAAGGQAQPSPQTTATAEPSPPPSPLSPDLQAVKDAVAVVERYYSAINRRDYRTAYELWSERGEASGKTFDEFRGGFANTRSVKIETDSGPAEIEGAAGSQYVTVQTTIKAMTKDGAEQNYRGSYVLRRSMVDGATREQREWHIYSADIQAVRK